MPKRFCACTGCPACNPLTRRTHGALFDLDTTQTLKCPGCQQHATTARQQRAPTASRGYGAAHQAERARLLALWQPGDPCALCTRPMDSSRGLDLAHNEDRTAWLGLAHGACNRATNRGRRGR